ncbi:MAG: hypothetical protein MJ108_04060 [Saccharofermentans sp.]|nr:hypothetical protein [Saccharofermentans sp.]
MRKEKLKELLIRVVILLVGLTIAHLGVTLFLLADIGSDPFNVLIQGLFRKSALLPSGIAGLLTHGRVHIIICFLIIAILLIVDRKYVKIGTILCMVCGGPIIDFFNWILGPLFAGDISLPVKVVVNVIGCAILAFGMTIVIKSEAGTGPNDLVAIVISDKLKFKFSIMRVIVDLVFAGTGFILGGTVGLGTIICAFVVGPVAGIFMPFNEKWIKNLVKKMV